jgi:hypothetical protein
VEQSVRVRACIDLSTGEDVFGNGTYCCATLLQQGVVPVAVAVDLRATGSNLDIGIDTEHCLAEPFVPIGVPPRGRPLDLPRTVQFVADFPIRDIEGRDTERVLVAVFGAQRAHLGFLRISVTVFNPSRRLLRCLVSRVDTDGGLAANIFTEIDEFGRSEEGIFESPPHGVDARGSLVDGPARVT